MTRRDAFGVSFFLSLVGCVGAEGAAVPPSWPVQIDGFADGNLVVAPDETHLAVLRDPRTSMTGCPNDGSAWTTGTLVLVTLRPQASPIEEVIGHDVPADSIFFRSDSAAVVFRDGVDRCGIGDLKEADPDGANARLIHASVGTDFVAGSTTFFSSTDDVQELAVLPAGGSAVRLGVKRTTTVPLYSPNAAGTAITYSSDNAAVVTATGSLILASLPSGEAHPLTEGPTDMVWRSEWSPRGGWLGFSHQLPGASAGSLTVVSADGRTRTDLTSDPMQGSFAFSPDDAWLAYVVRDPSGDSRLMTRSLIDGTDVPLGLLPSGTLFFTFSADAGNIVVQVEAGSGATGAYGASVGVSQSLAFLTSDGAAFVAQGGHVAAITATGAVQVLPISGGAPVVISQTVASGASFENGVANPLLLIWGSGLVVTASDGTGALEQPVPGYLGFALWLGPAVLYGITAIGEPLPTLSVLTGAGKRVTRLAALVGAYAWAPIAVPRRVFWSRAVANAGGLPGLWMVDLPP